MFGIMGRLCMSLVFFSLFSLLKYNSIINCETETTLMSLSDNYFIWSCSSKRYNRILTWWNEERKYKCRWKQDILTNLYSQAQLNLYCAKHFMILLRLCSFPMLKYLDGSSLCMQMRMQNRLENYRWTVIGLTI